MQEDIPKYLDDSVGGNLQNANGKAWREAGEVGKVRVEKHR